MKCERCWQTPGAICRRKKAFFLTFWMFEFRRVIQILFQRLNFTTCISRKYVTKILSSDGVFTFQTTSFYTFVAIPPKVEGDGGDFPQNQKVGRGVSPSEFVNFGEWGEDFSEIFAVNISYTTIIILTNTNFQVFVNTISHVFVNIISQVCCQHHFPGVCQHLLSTPFPRCLSAPFHTMI